MDIAIVCGLLFIIFIVLIFLLKPRSSNKKLNNTKLPPITKGRKYPWFYIKECLFYFPVNRQTIDSKEELLYELTETQKTTDYNKIIELCDEIISLDYKFSRIWLDKLNAIFSNVLSGKEWNASVSKNIANCCYNYIKSFSTSYEKSINAKRSLLSVILKRSDEIILYNRENASETYNFELYNLLINLYHMMPFRELLDLICGSLEASKKFEEVQSNSYAIDVIRSFMRYITLIKEKRNIIISRETVQELKITEKTIINDEEYSNSWIGFNILFPEGIDNVELAFKFYDNRRQEIDLSNGEDKKITEFFYNDKSSKYYELIILGEDRIKYVTIELAEEFRKRESTKPTKEDSEYSEIGDKVENNKELDGEENLQKNIEEVKEKKIEQFQNKIQNKMEEVASKIEEVHTKIEETIKEISLDDKNNKDIKNVISEKKENKTLKIEDVQNKIEEIESKIEEAHIKIEQTKKEMLVSENELEEQEKTTNSDIKYSEMLKEPEIRNLLYKIYPSFRGIKQIAMSENYCLLLKENGKIKKIGNLENSVNISNWEHIEKVYVNNSTAFGIRKDGSIVITGKSLYDNWEYQYVWENIQKLEPSYNHIVGLRKNGTVVAVGDNTYGQCNVEEWSNIIDISASFHTVGLNKEGKVFAVGNNKFGECDVENWTDIEKIATGPFYTIGLRADGTVVAVGLNSCGQCNTSEWKDVKEIYARGNLTAAVRYDGKVYVAGRNSYRFEDAKKWQNIREIKLVNDRIIGISEDGRVNYIGKPYWGTIKEDWSKILTLEANSKCVLGKKDDGNLVCNIPLFGVYMPDNYQKYIDIKEDSEADKVVVLGYDGKIDVYNISGINFYKWDTDKFFNIKQISISKTNLIGLRYDGTAIVTGEDNSLCLDVSKWKNIIKVEAGEKFVVGLTIDGRALAAGNNLYGQCDVNGWVDIVDISARGSKTVGIKSDGTVCITGFLEYDEEDFAKEASNMIGVAITDKQIMLLDSDGKVSVSYNPTGVDKREVLEWRNIKKIVANKENFIGLKTDGTLVSTGDENLDEWEKIDDIKASGRYILGLVNAEKR